MKRSELYGSTADLPTLVESFHSAVNGPTKLDASDLNKLLADLCKNKPNLDISPMKLCCFCHSPNFSPEFTFAFDCACSKISHTACLRAHILERSPDLSDFTVFCPACKAKQRSSENILKVFSKEEAKSIKGRFICQICQEKIDLAQEKSSPKYTFICVCEQRFHRSCLKAAARDLLKVSGTSASSLKETLRKEKRKFECKSCERGMDFDTLVETFSEKERKEIRENVENERVIQALLEGDLNANRMAALNKTFVCTICGEEKNVNKYSITLECDHRFCRECLGQHAATLIDMGKFRDEDLSCPDDKKPIGIYILKNVLSEVKFNCYQNLLLQNGPEVCSDDIMVKCPDAKCKYFFLMPKNSQIQHAVCVNCNTEFCVSGCKRPHKGKSCAEMQKIFKQEEKNEAADVKITYCPGCFAPVTKDKGCNHITCICKTEFCFHCGSKDYKSCGHYDGFFQRNNCNIY